MDYCVLCVCVPCVRVIQVMQVNLTLLVTTKARLAAGPSSCLKTHPANAVFLYSPMACPARSLSFDGGMYLLYRSSEYMVIFQ